MKTMPKLEVRNLPVNFIKQGKSVVAYSPALDLSTVGATQAKARKMFEEAVVLFFEELAEMGTMNEVLSGLGWQKVKKMWTPPLISTSPLKVRLPTVA